MATLGELENYLQELKRRTVVSLKDARKLLTQLTSLAEDISTTAKHQIQVLEGRLEEKDRAYQEAIQRMNTRHQEAMAQLREEHKREKQDQDSRLKLVRELDQKEIDWHDSVSLTALLLLLQFYPPHQLVSNFMKLHKRDWPGYIDRPEASEYEVFEYLKDKLAGLVDVSLEEFEFFTRLNRK